MTHLNHYKSGHTKLARDVSSLSMLETILSNPRVHTNKGRHVGGRQFDEEEDFGYRSGYSSGDYSSPRSNDLSDDGYRSRVSQSGGRMIGRRERDRRRDRSPENPRRRRDWSRSRSPDISRARRGWSRSRDSSRGRSRSRDSSRGRRDRSRDISRARRGRSRERSPRRLRKSRHG